MVLQRWSFDWRQIHIERSTGWALALVVNGAFLWLLTLPLRGFSPAPAMSPAPIESDWIALRPAEPTAPVPPPPQPPERARAVVEQVLRPSVPGTEPSILLDPMPADGLNTDPQAETDATAWQPPGPVATAADAEARIDYAYAPLPDYPRRELLRGTEGHVLLRVRVDAEGRVRQVEIERSSGSRALDRAAQLQVSRHWRFKPAQRNGRPVEGWVRVPIEFSLSSR